MGKYPVVMTIAGSDSGGGAGIQADLKTFAALGAHGTCALTSITSQNTTGVLDIHDLPPPVIASQIRAVASDMDIAHAKTGMLSSSDIILTVAEMVREYGIPLVVDPVMAAEAGGSLLQSDAVKTLQEKLIPLSRVVTPNIHEAGVLAGIKVDDWQDAKEAARCIVDAGANAIIITGGHLDGSDLLYDGLDFTLIDGELVKGGTHGAGCTYSAALTVFLATGHSLRDAAAGAKLFVTRAILESRSVGKGVGPVNPGWHTLRTAQMYEALSDVQKAVAILESSADFAALIPEVGCNIAAAVPHATSADEVCAVKGRIVRLQDRARSRKNAVGLQKSAQRILDELVLLKSISDTTRGVGDLESLFGRVTSLIREALQVEIVSLMMTDDEGNLQICAAAGLPANVVDEVRIPRTEGVAGQVLASGEAVLIDDLASDGRFVPKMYAGRYRTGSLLSVPIACHGRVLGVLNVNNKVNGETFVGSDLELLQTIAHQTSLAIENFKLVDRLRRQSEELQRIHSDLLTFHNDRNRFVCSLSHELKTPLTTILGFADLMVEQFDQLEPAKLREFLEKIHGDAIRLDELLSGMLRLFSIDSGNEGWHWEELDLTTCIEDSCQKFEVAMVEMDLDLEISLPDELLPVWGDRDKVGLLLDALLDNAVKYNRCGGTIRISAENSSEDGHPQVYLSIANQGQAFPAEYAEDFLQRDRGELNSPKKNAGIVGISLTICRAILHQMGGRVFLEATSEEGTSFGVLLPTTRTKSNE